MKDNKQLIEALANSALYRDYERAFSDTTGLPVSLRPVESWQLPHHGKRAENPFCALMAQKSRSCSACLRVHEQLSELAVHEPQSVTCEAGLCDTAVPVHQGEHLIGFLQTGQFFRHQPTDAQFERTARLVQEWGIEVKREELKGLFFGSRVLPTRQHEAVLRLLSIFAQHLSMLANQIVVQHEHAEPPLITRAKEFIKQHYTEELSLGRVSKAVNASSFYFCKMFKKHTGLNYTDYLSRVRIEVSKDLLLNPNLRISEIAFEVGFQSLTHFNRVFKKLEGQAPTQYRAHLPAFSRAKPGRSGTVSRFNVRNAVPTVAVPLRPNGFRRNLPIAA